MATAIDCRGPIEIKGRVRMAADLVKGYPWMASRASMTKQ